mmetsp:Transcript_50625/g.68883  ORF Transcript_50625/g.68883 Transcript_50625/m.68883 type:complete len:352 (-) Transcript_50625:125-1180(-)
MLRDEVRTGGYADAIMRNTTLYAGKTVLDVGTGSGVLAMFAAKAGAARVIGVDNSAAILDIAKKNVSKNGLAERVELVKGKIEELLVSSSPQSERRDETRDGKDKGDAVLACKVDVIVSEWMGYCLLYESMLPSVLKARDALLKPGGTLMPNRARMYIHGWRDGMESKAGRLRWWDSVHGVDLSDMVPLTMGEAHVEITDPHKRVTDRQMIQSLDLNTVTDPELDFEVSFEISLNSSGPLHGFVVDFDTCFDQGCEYPVTLETGAHRPATHWKQTLFIIDPTRWTSPQILDTDSRISGKFSMTRNEINPRDYDVIIMWSIEGPRATAAAQEQGDIGTSTPFQAYQTFKLSS